MPPDVPLWLSDSLAGSGGWHFPRWLRGDLPTCHGWGSALSSVCISVAPRPQQKWSRLTAPRGPGEGTHFCVVLSGHCFWEPSHHDVGKPRGLHGEVDVEGSKAADSQLTASTSPSISTILEGGLQQHPIRLPGLPEPGLQPWGSSSRASGFSRWQPLLRVTNSPTPQALFGTAPTAFPRLLQGTHHLSNRPAMCPVIRLPQTPPRLPATIAPLCPGSGMSSIVESCPPMYEASWASVLLLECEEGSDSQSFGHTEEPSRDVGCVLHVHALSPERTKCRVTACFPGGGLPASLVHPAHPNTSSPFVRLIGLPAPQPSFLWVPHPLTCPPATGQSLVP